MKWIPIVFVGLTIFFTGCGTSMEKMEEYTEIGITYCEYKGDRYLGIYNVGVGKWKITCRTNTTFKPHDYSISTDLALAYIRVQERKSKTRAREYYDWRYQYGQ